MTVRSHMPGRDARVTNSTPSYTESSNAWSHTHNQVVLNCKLGQLLQTLSAHNGSGGVVGVGKGQSFWCLASGVFRTPRSPVGIRSPPAGGPAPLHRRGFWRSGSCLDSWGSGTMTSSPGSMKGIIANIRPASEPGVIIMLRSGSTSKWLNALSFFASSIFSSILPMGMV